MKILHMPHKLSGADELRLAAVVGDELVGVASITEYGSPASTVYGLYVDPQWRRKGVGGMLVIEAESLVLENGGSALSAIVEKDGPLQWWMNRGFRVVQCESGRSLVARTLLKHVTKSKELQNACL